MLVAYIIWRTPAPVRRPVWANGLIPLGISVCHMQYFLLQDPNMLDNPRIRYSVQELDKSALQV